MKKALIIGGSGKLSGNLACQLIMAGYEVYAVTRGQKKLASGIHGIIADRSDEKAFEEAILAENTFFDVVFDCICMSAAHAAQDLRVVSKVSKRLVVVSTDSVYDPKRKSTPQTEEGYYVDPEAGDYAGEKRAMELVFLKEFTELQTNLAITIFRPGHIYGSEFALGCYPEESRKQDLPERILRGEVMKLVAGGIYIIHPIYVADMAKAMMDCVSQEACYNQIFCIGGPEAVENLLYYQYMADLLGVPLSVEEVALTGYAEQHPEFAGHLNHRIYDLSKLAAAGVPLPATHLKDGLRMSLEGQGYQVC